MKHNIGMPKVLREATTPATRKKQTLFYWNIEKDEDGLVEIVVYRKDGTRGVVARVDDDGSLVFGTMSDEFSLICDEDNLPKVRLEMDDFLW